MEKLVAGARAFRASAFAEKRELFGRLAAGQSPLALFVACSDSRIAPHLLTGADPGDLFVLRAVGNFIPAFGEGDGAEAATVEFAVAALGVRNIIVCGHSQCGAMTALVAPGGAALPSVERYLRHGAPALRSVRATGLEFASEAEEIAAVTEANVLQQLENLRTHPAVAVALALARGELELHGWVYDLATGDVRVYREERKAFVSLAE